MGTPSQTAALAALRRRLAEVTLADRERLERRLQRSSRPGTPAHDRLLADLDAAQARLQRRRAAVPVVSYPAELPVSARRDDLLAAIRDHQVVVVAGETGSGKTTQLPKVCLELGRGVRGMIGHTQPRRIAARAVAERIAEELSTPLGEAVGYAVRFTDRVGEQTLLKVMTDGILLAEIQRDRLLRRYDTIIVDEAHERSLNIDFLLGYLHQLLPRRPDLKLVLTSATIDPQRFARHFGDAPVVEVSGRMFPVEVRYRPLLVEPEEDEGADDPAPHTVARDQVQAVCDAVTELCAEGPGDVLVFLSGEREIRDTAEALERLPLRGTQVLPLYARLSAAEQHRVFSPHTGRRIVLATNVAETSLTVPGIRYVVDSGTARISRYSNRLKVQRLPIEPISQASALQRSGRCGRLADGICIRLYAEQDFTDRPRFTDPEILRTSLAAVILQMAALGLGDVAAFPFLDPPDRRQIADGIALLHELGALDPAAADPRRRLTPVGRTMAALPIDPRLARMIIEADRAGCLAEVLVIAAALSIQDPRERPAEARQAADERHARFADPGSDFLAYLNLWSYLQERQRELSSTRFRKLCAAEYLHYLRVREWQDLHAQLRQAARTLGMTPGTAVDLDDQGRDRVHRALLGGLLSHVALREGEGREYAGARGARPAIWPGSALARRPPRWIVAAELVETTRLWARVVARVEPEWVEQLAGHLVKRSYSEPRWERRRAAVVATERVTLYGLPLVTGRTVGYGRIDPELARELFIRHALVEGDWDTRQAFFHANRALVADVEELEHRARRRDILVDDQTLFAFYDARIGAEVVSGQHFDSWWKQARRQAPELLDYSASLLVNAEAEAVTERDYPPVWRQGDLELELTYQFEPGAAEDGVSVHIPLPVLNRVEDTGFDWLVPGLRAELVTALIRGLPKGLRRRFVPAPDTARAVLAALDPGPGDPGPGDPGPGGRETLTEAVGGQLQRIGGQPVTAQDWQPDALPGHLRMTFVVEDEQGHPLRSGKDLEQLRRQLQPRVQASISAAAADLERTGLTRWSFGQLPRTFEHTRGGRLVRGYPALVDEGASVAVRVLGTPAEQERAMLAGTRRLLLLTLPSPVREAGSRLSTQAKLTLAHNPHGGVQPLLQDCLACAVDRLSADSGGPAWDEDGFAALQAAVRPRLPDAMADVLARVERVLGAAADVERRLSSTPSLTVLASLTDAREQVDRLVYPGFVAATGWQRLPDLVRYLRALQHRLERLPERPERDRAAMAELALVQAAFDRAGEALPAARREATDMVAVRWMIEELRVGLFAQTIRTAYPVSAKRVLRAVAALAG